MIKAVTVLRSTGASEERQKLASFLEAVGFETGEKQQSGTELYSAPLANLAFSSSSKTAVDEIQIEVFGLDAIYSVAAKWLKAEGSEAEKRIAPITEEGQRRKFSVEPLPGHSFIFWESTDVFAGKPIAIEGDLSAAGMRFAIVVSRWNAVITDRLLQGSLDALFRSGAVRADVEVVRVPGAWEIPSAARALAEKKQYDAIITLGCLIRGETAHYEAIYNEVSRGIGQSQQETGIPHAFGVLTCETLEQALNRAGIKAGNKGFEAAVAAIEMVSIHRKLSTKSNGAA